VQRGAIDEREIGVRIVEKQSEICTRQNDRFDRIALHECMGNSSQAFSLLLQSFSRSSEFDIGFVDVVHLGCFRPHNFDRGYFPEESRFDDIASSKNGDSSHIPCRKFADEWRKNVEYRQRRNCHKLANAEMRGDGGDRDHLRSSGFQTANEAGQIFGQAVAIMGLNIVEDARCFRVDNYDLRRAVLRLKRARHLFVIVIGSSDAKSTDETQATR